MDDLSFERERLRRDLQETLNTADKAISCEGGPDQVARDALLGMRVILLGEVANAYLKAALRSHKEFRDAQEEEAPEGPDQDRGL
jgi:hypothetical protein